MIHYVFRDNRPPFVPNRSKADPQVIGKELARIKKKYRRLMPKEVVEEIRSSPKNPLRQHLTWNAEYALNIVQREEVRRLIACVQTWTEERPEPQTEYLSVLTGGEEPRQYYSRTEVLSDRDLQLALWEDAKGELDTFLRRFADLHSLCAEAAPLRKIIDAEIAKLKERETEDA
jgi:hypothetical protein